MVRCIARVLVLLIGGAPLLAQAPPDKEKYVSREEYNQLLEAFKAMKAEMDAMKAARAPEGAATVQDLDEVDQEIKSIRDVARASQLGSTKFLISGYGAAGYRNRDADNSTFSANFNPIFLWELSDKIFFEGEIELELENEADGGETKLDLEYSHLTYVVNDYITVGMGKFLSPFAIQAERLHPDWINKLPDSPLPFGHDGIAPLSEIGLQVRGGAPIGPTKVNYAFYVSNGPRLNTGEVEEDEAGLLHFDNYDVDFNNNKAVGGRVGFLPVPEAEIGYSWQLAEVDPSGTDFTDVRAFLQAVDFTYVRDAECLKGTVDIRSEIVWSDVEDVLYIFDGGAEVFDFNNERWGGYAQGAYRPSRLECFLKDMEVAFRYDWLDAPDEAPEAFDEERYTLGLNYWLGPSTVIKAAYRWDDRTAEEEAPGEDDDAFLFEAAIGF